MTYDVAIIGGGIVGAATLYKLQAKNPELKIIFEIEGEFDLIIEQTLFCAINPNQREKYVKQINRILKKGGKLVGLLFNREFESGPPFGGNVEEYQNTFSPYFEKIEISPCYNSIPARAGSEVFIQFIH